MKRAKFESVISMSRLRSIQVLMGFFFVFFLESYELISIPFDNDSKFSRLNSVSELTHSSQDSVYPSRKMGVSLPHRKIGELKSISGLIFDEKAFDSFDKNEFSELHKVDIESGKIQSELVSRTQNRTESCPNSASLWGSEFMAGGKIMVIPCGLSLGSHKLDDAETVMVSQFMIELQELKTVDGEDPPRILHFNPRLKGDWSGRPVIEQNTCYRMQWGSAMRCEGWSSKPTEDTLDGQVKCEKWIRDDDDHSEESKATWWLKRLIGGRKKVVSIDWPYPFVENKLFVLTVSAGLEGYHINIDGRHITSYPYRTGFTLADATGLFVNGDIDVHSVFAASLPSTHPNFSPQRHLEMLPKLQAPPLPDEPVELLIGILSAGNHFSERMAVRKSWMQHPSLKSSNVVTRFFVAMHGRKEINVELMKEAEYFGDIVIVPYMDNYDLVALKTVPICEWVAAKYVMKCDDDTFVRIDAVTKEVKKVHSGRSLYVGNINYCHKPLRHGKWAVTYELFKMEDVNMGMWVEQFNSSRSVEYVHSLKFCQFGCIDDYYTAHYQSPRQMICLWRKLLNQGKPLCCNVR
ncbi:unnamed protein product [Withania somnifera]